MIKEDDIERSLTGDFLSSGYFVISADVISTVSDSAPWSIYLAVSAQSEDSARARVMARFSGKLKEVVIRTIRFDMSNLDH